MSRPIRARIDLSALRVNLEVARAHAGPTKILAVLKANAYGHGLLRAARAHSAADGFAVLDLNDALALQPLRGGRPVVLLQGFFEAAEVREIARWNLTPVVHSAEQLALLLSSGSAAQMEIYLKLNSGMNRLGLPEAEWRAAIPNLERSGVRRITLMTHFSAAEETAGIQEQLDRFNHAAIGLRHPRSLANSAALLRFPSAIGDWARPGLMLYGASPFTDRSASSLGLRPAMTLSSAIIATQNLAPGARVGYGGTFTADRALRIGVVACGYGDGYPRHAPTGTPVLVDGTRTRILGRISMDMLCVDLTPLPQAGVGTEVILWGGALPVEEVAKWSDTVSYELLCALAPRVPVVESDG